MNLPIFQLVVPAPRGAPFAALAARCEDEKILSVDYLPSGLLEEAKKQVSDPQKQKVVGKIEEQLTTFFEDPKSADFGELPLCYSDMREQHCEIWLPTEERRKVLEKLSEPGIIPCGEVCAYKDIGDAVDWDSKKAVKIAVKEAYPDKKIKAFLAKAVGDVCPANPFGVVVPCFRVVRKQGPEFRLGQLGRNPYLESEGKPDEEGKGKHGWEIGREIKRWLIEHEGGYKVIPATESKLRRVGGED